MADSRTVEPPSTVQKVYSGAADGQRELLALIGCYIYIGLHFMDLSQAEPFVGSAGSSRGF